jgi:LPS export ABC transporter protein LptC
MPSASSTNNLPLKKKIKKKWKLLFLAPAWAILCLTCENNMKAIPSLRKKQVGVETGRDIESYYSIDAKVKAKLTSPYMVRYLTDSPYVEFPKSLHVDFYNDTMRIQTKMDAKYGKYYQYANRVFLRDSVIVKNTITGDTLKTNELWWDNKKQILYNDKPSHILKKDGTQLFARDGLEAAQDLSWYTFKKVSGPVSVPANGLPK